MATVQNPYAVGPSGYGSAVRDIAGALLGTPQDKMAQQQLQMEQARTDATVQGIQSQIAERDAMIKQREQELGLAQQLNAAQVGNYQASAAKAAAERDRLAAELQGLNTITPKLEGLFTPRQEPAVNAPLNPQAQGPAQIPARERLPNQQEFIQGLGSALAPMIVARGGDPANIGDFLLATQALGANYGVTPPKQQETTLRNALIGTGEMPDLDTALTTGRQNEVINLNAANERSLEQIKPPTTSNIEAGVWQKVLTGQPITPQEEIFLNRDASKTTVGVDAQGNPILEQTSGMSGFGTVANNALDKAVIDADKNLMNLQRMQQTFDPAFATIPGKAGAEITDIADKLNLGTATPEDIKKLEDYSVFAQTTMTGLNDYIRAMTGAALSPGEVQRALAVMPTIGTGGIMGIIQGDGPIRFQAKLNSMIDFVEATKRRAVVLKQQGINALDDSMLNSRPDLALDNFMGGAPVQGLGAELQPSAPTKTRIKFDAQGNPM